MNRTGWTQTRGDIEAELLGIRTQIRLWEAICEKQTAYYGQAFAHDLEILQALKASAEECQQRLEACQ